MDRLPFPIAHERQTAVEVRRIQRCRAALEKVHGREQMMGPSLCRELGAAATTHLAGDGLHEMIFHMLYHSTYYKTFVQSCNSLVVISSLSGSIG
jgi:hypothetical protein